MDEHRENCKTETKNIRKYEIEVTDFSGFCYTSTLGASEISPIANEQSDAPEREFIQKVMQRKAEVK